MVLEASLALAYPPLMEFKLEHGILSLLSSFYSHLSTLDIECSWLRIYVGKLRISFIRVFVDRGMKLEVPKFC